MSERQKVENAIFDPKSWTQLEKFEKVEKKKMGYKK